MHLQLDENASASQKILPAQLEIYWEFRTNIMRHTDPAFQLYQGEKGYSSLACPFLITIPVRIFKFATERILSRPSLCSSTHT